MRFIKFTHPEGGTQIVNVERITSATHRLLDDGRARLSLDLGEKTDAVTLFGEEAARAWGALEGMVDDGAE